MDVEPPLLNEEERMELDDPELDAIMEEYGDDLEHLGLEYKHRHRDAPRVLDPNVAPLPWGEDQVGGGAHMIDGPLFRFRLGAILDRYERSDGCPQASHTRPSSTE